MSRRREPGYIPGNGKCHGKGCSKTLSPHNKPLKSGRWFMHLSRDGMQKDVLLCPECYKKSKH